MTAPSPSAPASAPSRLRVVLPWLVFAAALVLATSPVWRLLLIGAEPSLEELLQLRCVGGPRPG